MMMPLQTVLVLVLTFTRSRVSFRLYRVLREILNQKLVSYHRSLVSLAVTKHESSLSFDYRFTQGKRAGSLRGVRCSADCTFADLRYAALGLFG